jgi:hypothetical protein
MVAQILQ